MKPRSIVLDLCGDYVRYHGGAIGLSAMTELLRSFGVGEDNVRTVMSRLRREGFFDTRRDGRTTSYVITPGTLRTLDEGRERIFARTRRPWDGTWHMVIYQVPESARASRERLRKGLSWLGFGPLAASTWVSAHHRRDQVSALFSVEQQARFDQVSAVTGDLADDRAMAARCWDLDQLATDYREWMTHWRHAADGVSDDRAALITRTTLVNSFRRFPFSDPDLPAELLPADWPGVEAHELFLHAYDRLRPRAERFYRSIATVEEIPNPT